MADSVPLTPASFDDPDWRDIRSQARSDQPLDYAVVFFERARKALVQGSMDDAAAFNLLGDVCSFSVRLDDPATPFAPSYLAETFKSASPDQLLPEHVDILKELAPTVADPVLRARLADAAWVLRRHYGSAVIAVEAYLELASRLDSSDGTLPPNLRALRDLERAIQLALQLGPKNAVYDRVRTEVNRLLSARAAGETGFLSRDLIRLARVYGTSSPSDLYGISAEIAERAEDASEWQRAEGYWEEAGSCAGNNQERRREALHRVADTYVRRAEEEVVRPHIGKIQAAGYMQKAIEALRRAGGSRERIDREHARMIEFQRGIPEALQAFTHSIDITEAVTTGQQVVDATLDGKSLPEALVGFAAMIPLPRVADLLRQAQDNESRYLFRRFFPAVQHSLDGKVVAREGDGLRADMLQMAREHHTMLARVLVQPARLKLVQDHLIRVHDLLWTVVNNPIVPPGREMLYAEAFYAGFVGDMPKALHILVHQVEHSIRHLLQGAGKLTTSLSSHEIQTEQSLNKLVFMPELKELLGEDEVFALQGLLVEGFGFNLRNRVAHGLVAYDEFFDSACLYFWWFCIRMCCLTAIGHGPGTTTYGSNPSEAEDKDQEPRGD